MRCIFCGEDTKVVDARLKTDNIMRRRRECLVCGSRFTTYEMPYKIKNDSEASSKSLKINECIRSIRLTRGISLREMSKLLNYSSPASYMNIEKGKVELTINKLNEIATILDYPIEYFLKQDK